MAKISLTDPVNLQNENSVTTAINNNNASIEDAIENTLSRDGTSPNSMNATLDMNSNPIINLPEPSSDTEPVRRIDVEDLIPVFIVDASEPDTTYAEGSLWIDSDSTDQDLYQLQNDVWSDTGVNLKGNTGSTGAAGIDGSTWYTGDIDPDNGDGADGDFYLQTDSGATGVNGDVWAKASGTWSITGNIKGADGAGSGDVSGPSSSVDNEIALFNSTTGKLIKRASTTGILKGTSGVLSAAVAGTDYYNPGGTDVAIADGGTGASTAAGGFDALKQAATETYTGVVELATVAEAEAGTDDSRAVTPEGVAAAIAALGGGGGLWTNTRLAKTAAYTVLNADKGVTLACGGTAYYTITIGAASGFDDDFAIRVVNEDTARAKLISCDGQTSFRLWPKQTALIYNNNDVWYIDRPQRWKLTGNVVFNIDYTNGSDDTTVDGGALTTGAFQTCEYAYELAVKEIDFNGNNTVTCQLLSGTQTLSSIEGFQGKLVGCTYGAGGNITSYQPNFIVKGTGQGGGQTSWASSSLSHLAIVQSGATVSFDSMNITNSAGEGIVVAGDGYADIRNIDINNVSSIALHAAGPQAYIFFGAGNRLVSSTTGYVFVIESGASMIMSGAFVLTGATSSFTTFLEVGLMGAGVDAVGFSYSGTAAVGKRCNVANLGGIYTGGGALSSFFPGNADGTAGTLGSFT